MRRLLFSLAAVCLTGIGLAGVSGCYCTSGVCDCDLDRDPCVSRAPWALIYCANGNCANGNGGHGSPVAPVLGAVAAPPSVPVAPPPVKESPREDAPQLEVND